MVRFLAKARSFCLLQSFKTTSGDPLGLLFNGDCELHGYVLPPRSRRGLRFCGTLHGVDWYLVSDVLEQPIRPIFKAYLIPEDGTDKLFRNVAY